MDVKFNKALPINFKAMKSSQFKSLEYSAMRKFKAPIETFNSVQCFYDWAAKRCLTLAETELGGKDAHVRLRRQVLKKDWLQYLKNLDGVTIPVVLLIFSSMLKGLKENNSDLLPQLDEEVFQETLKTAKIKVDTDRDYKFNFKKAYIDNLRQKLAGSMDTWVVIPSKKTDEANFEINLERLKALSPRTWCTKNDKADEYLEESDIHIYLKKGIPEIGLRVKDGKILDITGFANNGKIPQEYLFEIKNYINEKQLSTAMEAKSQINSAEELHKIISLVRENIGDAIDSNDVFKIMDYFGYKPKYLEDGTISISGYMQPIQGNFSELGIDENKLFERISEIRGNAFFRNCTAFSLKNIKKIGGMVNFSESHILDTGKLEDIGGDLYLANSKIREIPKLRRVGGTINYQNSMLSECDLKGLLI